MNTEGGDGFVAPAHRCSGCTRSIASTGLAIVLLQRHDANHLQGLAGTILQNHAKSTGYRGYHCWRSAYLVTPPPLARLLESTWQWTPALPPLSECLLGQGPMLLPYGTMSLCKSIAPHADASMRHNTSASSSGGKCCSHVLPSSTASS